MSLSPPLCANLTIQLNMKVGKKLAAGIETGQETAASAKETVGMSFLLPPHSLSLLGPFIACLLLPHTNKNTTNNQPRTSHQPEKSRERQRKLGNPPTRV
jgi:hypothetical protein